MPPPLADEEYCLSENTAWRYSYHLKQQEEIWIIEEKEESYEARFCVIYYESDSTHAGLDMGKVLPMRVE